MSDDLIRIPSVFRRGIESSLGRPVELSDKEVIQDLREVDASTVEDLKRIAEENDFVFSESYLKYLTPKKNHRYLMDFLTEVVLGGKSADDWMRNVVIFVDIDGGLYKYLDSTKTAMDLLRVFANQFNGVLGEIPLIYNAQSKGVNYTGCPCVLVENFNYWDSPSEPLAVSALDVSVFKVAENLDVLMFRYWMALSARCIRDELRDPNAGEAEIKSKLTKMSGLEVITPFLQTGLDVLLKERELLGCEYSDDSPPGYCIDESHFINLI